MRASGACRVTSFTSSVPTALERSSGFTNLTDVLTSKRGSAPGPTFWAAPFKGHDPRSRDHAVRSPAGTVDPVSGLHEYFRRRRLCSRSFQQRVRTGHSKLYRCRLPRPQHASRRPHRSERRQAAESLSLPPNGGHTAPYQDSPGLYEHSNTFDTREDFNPNEKNQIFARFSYVG